MSSTMFLLTLLSLLSSCLTETGERNKRTLAKEDGKGLQAYHALTIIHSAEERASLVTETV